MSVKRFYITDKLNAEKFKAESIAKKTFLEERIVATSEDEQYIEILYTEKAPEKKVIKDEKKEEVKHEKEKEGVPTKEKIKEEKKIVQAEVDKKENKKEGTIPGTKK